MSWLFVIKDKTGRWIHLSQERWTHIQKHPEMSSQVEQIKETLLSPLVIIQLSDDLFVHFYYRYYKNVKSYLFVSVKYLNGDGFIITSFYTDEIVM